MTSSKISTMPWRSVTSRSFGRKPSTGGSSPPLHMNGSTMSAAIEEASLVRISSQASGSFHGNTTVFLSTPAGMPADHAMGLGRRRLPHALVSPVTLTMTASWVPWKAPSNLASLGRSVKARARRTAFIVASVPELVKRRLSTEGTRRTSVSASRISYSVGPGNDRPDSATACTAFTTSGVAWPSTRLV